MADKDPQKQLIPGKAVLLVVVRATVRSRALAGRRFPADSIYASRQLVLTSRQMTLLGAVHSLGIAELAAVSWINICPIGEHYVAEFMMALLLPFTDPELSEELHGGRPRFWPDQVRVLESTPPIADQIRELQATHILGDLDSLYVAALEGQARALWIVETHAGSDAERKAWLGSVIAMEGRSPVP
jgi:hypothetical protein